MTYAMNKRTVLYDRHQAAGARMVPFAGWDMPVQYRGVIAEHLQTRSAVSVFDTSHMNSLRVSGAAALDSLSRLLTADLRTLKDGRCRYGFLLRADGGILDDLIVYRFSADDWMLVVNAGTAEADRDWIADRIRAEEGTTLEDLRPVMGKLDLQGPDSETVMKQLLGVRALEPRRFGFVTLIHEDRHIIVSRTGYTGENGFEIYAPLDVLPDYWDRMVAAGAAPAGLGARDTLRLEAGLPLYGHELSVDVTPVEAGMMRYAAKEEDFMGRDALVAKTSQGVSRRLTGFVLDGRQTARQGQSVIASDGRRVGEVTSGSFAPSLGHAVGLAYLERDVAVEGSVIIVEAGRRQLEARVVPPPFYRRPTSAAS